MITFKQFLYEEQFKTGVFKGRYSAGAHKITMYKNPTSKELKLLKDARGVVSIKGDLYMLEGSGVHNAKGGLFIHEDILAMLTGIIPFGGVAHNFFNY